jgi:hypothetical protein
MAKEGIDFNAGKRIKSSMGRYNEDGSAKTPAIGLKAGGGGDPVSAGIDSVVGLATTFAPMVDSMNTGKAERMDKKGTTTHDVSVGGNAVQGAMAGAKAGKMFGPWGAAIGGAVGGAGGAIMGMIDLNNQPTFADNMNTRNKFDMGLQIGNISANDTQPQQAQAAKNGMKYVNGTKEIEVEKDEIVLRKSGNTFSKKADFTGGKSHMQGGEDYIAEEGDIIMPGKKRLQVNKALRTRDWKKIESMRQQLPADPVGGMAAKGVKEVKGTGEPDKREKRWNTFLAQPGVKAKVEAISEKHGFSPSDLMAVFDLETANTLDPAIKNPTSSGSGLIQFMEATAKDFNTTTKDIRAMDVISQLGLVEQYYDKYHKFGDHPYDIVVGSASGSKEDSDILYKKGSKNAEANPTWQNENGDVTKESARNATKNFYVKDYEGFENSVNGPNEYVPGASKSADDSIVNDAATEYEKYVKQAADAGVEPQSETWYQHNVLDAPERVAATEEAKQVAQRQEEINAQAKQEAEYAEEDRFWNEQTAIRHRGTDKGKAAAHRNLQAKQRIDNTWDPADDPENASWADYINKWASDLGRNAVTGIGLGGQKLQDVLMGTNEADKNNELQFEDTPEGDALSKEYQDIIFETIDDQEILSLAGLVDSANFITKFTSSLGTGQGTAGSDLYRGANLLSMYDEETIAAIKTKLEAKGISKEGMYLFNDMAKSPQNYYSSNIEGAEAIDVLTMLVNPKGAISGAAKAVKKAPQVIRAGGRVGMAGTKAGIKATMAGAKWTKAKAKKAIDYLKTVDYKDIPRAAWNGLDRMMQEAPMYAKGEDMMDILKEIETLSKGAKGVPEATELGKKVKEYTTLWNEFSGYAKGKANTLSKLIRGSSFDELKQLKEKVKSTTGLEWSEAKLLSKKELAMATKKQMRGLEDNVKGINTKMKSHQAALKAKKLELLEENARLGKEFSESHPDVVKIQKEMDAIADKMDNLNVQGEKLRKQVPLAFDENYNIIEGTQIIKDGKVVDRADKLGETYKSITKIMDDSNDAFQRADKIRKAKTAEQVAEYEKMTLDALNKAGKDATAASNKGLRPLTGEKIKALGEIEDLKDLRKKFPEMYNKLQQAGRIDDLPKDLAGLRTTLAQIANDEPGMGVEADYKPAPGEAPGAINPPVEEVEIIGKTKKEEDGGGIGGTVTPYKPAPVKAEIPAGDKGGAGEKKIGERLSGALNTLSGYAPAIYNIVRGLEDPDKVQRRFVTPQTREFQPMAQPQLNAIEDAFQTSVANARNLSGGMASNFRSNTEKAWADKIARTGQVNAQEAQRADQVAAENIGIRNQADQYNTQANAKYDEIDMRSEAATKSFLGQGIQDVANIGSRNKKDALAEKNQQTMMGLMDTGNYSYNPDTNKVEFSGGAKQGAVDPAPPSFAQSPIDIQMPEIDLTQNEEGTWIK